MEGVGGKGEMREGGRERGAMKRKEGKGS